MKIKGALTLMVGREQITIEIEDREANTRILSLILTPEDFCAALGRQAYIDCELTIGKLERVGSKHENSTLEFEIPNELRGSKHADELNEIAKTHCTDGWIPEGYYGSQNSFFTKDSKDYARVTIRRYVPRETTPNT